MIALGGYWSATRHPWSCVLFVVPLLAIYEVGLYTFGQAAPDTLRNGADVWLRTVLARVGIIPEYGAPCFLLGILLVWCLWRYRDRPADPGSVWCGMAMESAFFGLTLFGLCLLLGHGLTRLDQYLGEAAPRPLLSMSSRSPEPTAVQIVSFLGAGIYEETLFRLLLYTVLVGACRLADIPARASFFFAALGSALAFAAAHHVGAGGELFNGYVFTFRTCAGVYFAWLYQARGFGIAVGAHAGYDVGLLLRNV